MAEKKTYDFKQNLKRLDEIVELLNNDTLSIEESLLLFNEGKQIIHSLTEALSEVEEKVEKVIIND